MEAHRAAHQYGLIAPVVEQPQYNLFERNKMENEFLMIFRTVGMGTTIWSPLASGLLSGKYNNGIPEGSRFGISGFDWLKDRWMKEGYLDKVNKLNVLALELGITLAQLSIAWCITNTNVSSTILGATKKEQLTENLGAIEASALLTPEVLQKIEEIVESKPILPEH
jgi:aryl-alcohol dehydrogenase-like predicted oxidoreductase